MDEKQTYSKTPKPVREPNELELRVMKQLPKETAEKYLASIHRGLKPFNPNPW